MRPISDTQAMIAGMTPRLQPGTFVFCAPDRGALASLMPAAVAYFAEAEGPSLIVPVDAARAAGVSVDLPMRLITLEVFSSLDGIGLTAAVAERLMQHGIACNIVAAMRHDHVFVPAHRAEEALAALRALQALAQSAP